MSDTGSDGGVGTIELFGKSQLRVLCSNDWTARRQTNR